MNQNLCNFLPFFSCKFYWIDGWLVFVLCLMVVCTMYSMNVQVTWEQNCFLLVFNLMCMCFLYVKIANVLCWEKSVLYVFNHMWFIDLFLCVFFGSCFCVCVLCLQSYMGHLLFTLCVLFIVWDECATWLICGWCFMPLDYCCQVQGCESKCVKDRTSWSKRGVAKNPQNWQKIFILMLQYSK